MSKDSGCGSSDSHDATGSVAALFMDAAAQHAHTAAPGTQTASPMVDVQNYPAGVPLGIDRVGVKGLKLPLVVNDRRNGSQHTVASVDMGVDLPAEFKGTHMSRFVELLGTWNETLDYRTIKLLLAEMKVRLMAKKSYVRFSFPYFILKKAPVSGISALMAYD